MIYIIPVFSYWHTCTCSCIHVCHFLILYIDEWVISYSYSTVSSNCDFNFTFSVSRLTLQVGRQLKTNILTTVAVLNYYTGNYCTYTVSLKSYHQYELYIIIYNNNCIYCVLPVGISLTQYIIHSCRYLSIICKG